ncbi:hypothetical protein DV589_24780 [Salmonella enterica]|nr:hypothetical protein [Salmonella enterica]EKF0976924.1 hypothetical protein [Salmonella enterica]
MKSLHNLTNLLALLDKKKKILSGHLNVAQERLHEIRCQINEYKNMIVSLKQTMASLYSPGEISRDKLYRNIQNQGRVLYKQQMLEQKIIELESEVLVENKIISQYREEILKADRKHQRLSLYIDRQKRKNLLERDARLENEIIEIIAYGRENYREKYS